jgi:hypothetical protein
MSAEGKSRHTAPESRKENAKMSKRFATIAATLGAAVLLLAVLPIASASAAEPWWQVVTGSRPTNMWEPKDAEEVQEVKTEKINFFGEELFAGKVEVGGSVVGCLAAGEAFGTPAGAFCESETGFSGVESAADFETMLEGPYGAGEVEVSGGPVGGAPFQVTTSWGVASVKVTPFGGLGTASSKVVSEGSGRLVLTLTNLGDAPVDGSGTPVTITDELPEGVVAYDVEASAGGFDVYGGRATPPTPVSCVIGGGEVACTYEGELPSYSAIEVEVLALLEGSPPVTGAPGRITVSGGNAAPAEAVQSIKVSDEPVSFGIEKFSAVLEEEGGKPASQAGAHPFQLTTTLQLNAGRAHTTSDKGVDGAHWLATEQPALPRNLRFPLPAGLAGNATTAPQCDMATFLRNYRECPDEAVLGVSAVTFIESANFGLFRGPGPVFNVSPSPGEPARFAFNVAGDPVIIDTAVDPDDQYRIIASVSNASQLVQFLGATTTFWGVPGDPRHDSARGEDCLHQAGPCERPAELSEDAFLRIPTQCATPLDFGLSVEPWNVPIGSVVDSKSFAGSPLIGCNRVPFDPSIASAPTAKLAESPSGLDFKLSMPNSGLLNKEAIAEGQPKRIEVTLPEGMTLNPSQAEGLATCSPAQYAREKFNSRPGEGCPEASKIGSVTSHTPLIDEPLQGALYVAEPHNNPFDSLIALYIVARAPERGVLVKQPLEVRLDKQTGRIVTIADHAPPAPYEDFQLHFREGGRSPLVTPPACGSYDIIAKFTPYSAQNPQAPEPSEVVTRKSTFTIEHGVDGGACPPGGVPPFDPGFEAGSINNDAGSFSPFNMRLTRKDGEQDMTKFSAILPPGVLGSLAGVGKCSEAGIAAAKAKTGKEEQASPSCPQSSQIGHTTVGAGVGSVLTWIPGKLYLGGPYKGDPLSVISITPAVAGPFDVGNVVVQEALTLNPKTAEVQVDGSASDPIPHILEGVPAKLRDLRVYVDRDRFILNPTSCEESSVKSTLFGGYLDVFSAADDVPVGLSTRYQAANCANLGFKPKLNLKLKGGTRRGAHPGLKATYTPRKGDANLKGLTVRLPSSAFLDQAHIRTICTRVQFAAKNCPKAAQYGFIKATTPLLDEPLEGPVYLRSSNHKLPDLVFDLHGLVDVEVATRIDSVHGGIRATVEEAPDAPLTKVVLRMQGAKKGLIVNSRNLCGGRNRANEAFRGQNGKEASAKPVLQPDCGGKRKHKAKKHSR